MTTAIAYVRSRIGTVAIPGPDEAADLAGRRDRGDDDARRELIERNVPLALHLAAKAAVELAAWEPDLVQAALLGLVRAADEFDPSRGIRFSTYATVAIRRSIRGVGEAEIRGVAVPVNLQRALFARGRGRAVAGCYGVPDAARDAAAGRAMGPAAGGDRLASVAVAHDPGGAIDRDERAARLAGAVASLPPRSAEILRLRFGLDGDGELTLEQVARRFGVTRERIRQVEAEALGQLARMLKEVAR